MFPVAAAGTCVEGFISWGSTIPFLVSFVFLVTELERSKIVHVPSKEKETISLVHTLKRKCLQAYT